MSVTDNSIESIQLFLASSSPRRAELLKGLGLVFQALPSDVDEALIEGEPPAVTVMRLAQLKSDAGRRSLGEENRIPVLGADTIVVYEGQVLGKPSSEENAMAMLRKLSGNWHEVLTAVNVSDGRQGYHVTSENRVKFRVLTDTEIQAYWTTGEPQDKAGAYAIQGLGAMFVERLEGSYSGVVGLPIFETANLLRKFNITTEQIMLEYGQ